MRGTHHCCLPVLTVKPQLSNEKDRGQRAAAAHTSLLAHVPDGGVSVLLAHKR